MRSMTTNKKGYSLIEVMVALVIFMIIVLYTAQMLVASMQSNIQSANTTSAYYISQRFIDKIEHDMELSPDIADSLSLLGPQTFNTGPSEIYAVTWRVYEYDADAIINEMTRAVEVSVAWGTRSVTTRAIVEIP